jgi:hypothetical protein
MLMAESKNGSDITKYIAPIDIQTNMPGGDNSLLPRVKKNASTIIPAPAMNKRSRNIND